MKLSTLFAPLTLSAALAFSGAAFADTMVAGKNISDTDLPRVQAKCDELLLAEQSTTGGTMSTTGGTTEGTGAAPATSGMAGSTSGGASTAVTATTAEVDALLETLTVVQCREAGLVQ